MPRFRVSPEIREQKGQRVSLLACRHEKRRILHYSAKRETLSAAVYIDCFLMKGKPSQLIAICVFAPQHVFHRQAF